MAVSGKYRCFLQTTSWEPLYWDGINFDEDEFWHFIEENPMPESKVYSDPNELLNDFKNASGIITLPADENNEFVEWMEDLLERFL